MVPGVPGGRGCLGTESTVVTYVWSTVVSGGHQIIVLMCNSVPVDLACEYIII